MTQEISDIKELVGKRDLMMVQRSINSQKLQSQKISKAFGNKVNMLNRISKNQN